MNRSCLWFRLLSILLCSAETAFCLSIAPPDKRTWEQVTADFIAREGQHANDGDYDGRRLKELDPKRAVSFLMPFLAKDCSFGLRVKAIGALGWSSFKEAVPALCAIAKDATDNEEVRAEALNPGLRYMKNPQAVETAASLAEDNSVRIRGSAYWVLSDHGTDKAVAVLEARLRSNDRPLFRQLIYALAFSKHPRAGQIVFDNCAFSTLQPDEELLRAYSIAMESYHVPEAQQNMLTVAQQPGHPLSAYYALRYFSAFPRQDVVPALIARIEAAKPVNDLYETVTQFIKSPKITDESKKTLSEFITSGKVKKAERLFP